MPALVGMQSRRRAVTYGKAARKPISAFSLEAADTFAHISHPDDYATVTEYRSLGSKVPTAGATSDPNIKSLNLPYALSSDDPVLYSPDQDALITKQKSQINAISRHKTLYDIPSSDDSGDAELSVSGMKARKKRKITPQPRLGTVSSPKGATSQEKSNASCFLGRGDNKGPGKTTAPHLSGDKFHNGEKAQTPLKPSIKQYRAGPLGRHGRDAYVPSREGQRHFEHRARYGSTQVNQRVAIVTLKEPDSRPLGTSIAASESQVVGAVPGSNLLCGVTTNDDQLFSSANVSQPKTPPKSSSSTSKITTPHQHKLWSMLLPANPSSAAPSSSDLPNLTISEAQDKLHSPGRSDWSAVVEDNVPTRTSRTLRQRRRLVDTLQIQAEEPSDADSVQESKSSGAEDDGSERADTGDHHEEDIEKGFGTQDSTASAGIHSMIVSPTGQRTTSKNQPLPAMQSYGPKVTYARHRSYLSENDLREATVLNVSEPQYPTECTSNKRAHLLGDSSRLQHAPSAHEELQGHELSQATTLRSIHELREAGGNVRLLSEIEAILDDIENDRISLSLRRSRLLELTRRLEEPLVRQLFTEREFERKLSRFFGSNVDPILMTVTTAAILLLLTESTSSQTLSYFSSPLVLNHLVALLDMGQDIMSVARTRALNMSRAAQVDLKDYWKDLLQSNKWRARKPPYMTSRVLSLQCLEYLVRQSREAGISDQILEHHAIDRIVRLLHPSIIVGLSAQQPSPNTDIQLAVSILESCTMVEGIDNKLATWSGGTLDTIVTLLPSLDNYFSAVPEPLIALVLRLYINLTNNCSQLCEAFSVPTILRSVFNIIISYFRLVTNDSAPHASRLDNLILALGLLINLAEWCDIVPRMMAELQYEQGSFLDYFVQLFKSSLDTTAEVSALSQVVSINADWARCFRRKKQPSTWHLVIYQYSLASPVLTM